MPPNGTVGQRPDLRPRVARVTRLQGFRSGAQALDERVADRAQHDDAVGCHARLAVVGERAERCGPGCVVEVRVI
jgi:hypothetical protein